MSGLVSFCVFNSVFVWFCRRISVKIHQMNLDNSNLCSKAVHYH